MQARQIILRMPIFLAALSAACDTLAQTMFSEPGPMFFTPVDADCSTPKPVFIEPIPADCSSSRPFYVQPPQGVVIPNAPPNVVPLVPLPQGGAPRVPHVPGPTFAPPGMTLPNPSAVDAGGAAPVAGPFSNIAPGGSISPMLGLPGGPDLTPGPNPILVPVTNDEAAWEEIVNVVSDYFPVWTEQQARRSGPVWTEGVIETGFRTGPSIFEPFSKSSVGAFNRWESTFQTIRRNAVVRVIPDGTGYQVEVIVQKELEDLARPEHATAGIAAFPSNGSLPSQRIREVNRLQSSPHWIPLGRDPALEKQMLADIQARFTGQSNSSRPTFWW